MEVQEELAAAVRAYQMPERARMLLTNSGPLLLCGITAAGKSTLMRELIKQGGYEAVISHTTRRPRYNHGEVEKHGINYYFVNEDDMLKMVHDREFVEVKQVHDSIYGTSQFAYEAVLSNNNIPILDIDIKGAEEFVLAIPALRPVFLLPPSFEVWQRRLSARGELTRSEINVRYKSALDEISKAVSSPAFQLVINTDKVITAKAIREGAESPEAEARRIAQEILMRIESYLAKNSP